jgi:perosamine synthetase
MESVIQIQPYFDDEEEKELLNVIRSTWVIEHSKTEEMEEMWRSYTNSPYAIAVSNGTVALLMCILASDIGYSSIKGSHEDEVIVPNISFVATANAVILAGAKPVVVEVNEANLHINLDEIEKAITPNTKAIIPVHLYGDSVEMDKLNELAQKHNLIVIEDAAQALGVTYKDQHAGTFGDFSIFSLYGNKTITSGEGGVILCKTKENFEKLFRLKNHGRLERSTFIHEEIGYNFRFTDLQAAIGVAQMKKIDWIIKRKQEIYDHYFEALKNHPAIRFSPISDDVNHTHWFTNIMVDDAESVGAILKDQKIQTRQLFYPFHQQPGFRGIGDRVRFASNSYDVSERLYKQFLSLPSSVQITEEELNRVVNALISL